jgi:hypothetical protein
MAAEDEFMNDPLDFLSRNLLLPTEFQGEMTAGIKCFKLRANNNKIAKRLGVVLPVWELVPGPPPGILSYWCPYRGNELHSVTVGTRARFMFTATMDGCSLGVGHDVGNGTRLVSHVNSSSYGAGLEGTLGMDKAREEQRKMQSNLLRFTHGVGNVNIVGPLTYMKDVDGELALKSTTFGFRPDGVNDWQFYTHRYYKDMSGFSVRYFLRDTIRVF